MSDASFYLAKGSASGFTRSVWRFASHAFKKAGKVDEKTKGDNLISEMADAQAYRRGRWKTDPAGHWRRNFRFLSTGDDCSSAAGLSSPERISDRLGIAAWGLLSTISRWWSRRKCGHLAELDVALQKIWRAIDPLSEMRWLSKSLAAPASKNLNLPW